jgi:Papain-like cysteine protease AvrRpt2
VIGAFRDAAEAWERRWDASIDLELERQNGRNWCWAAVAKGIVEHYGGPRRKQCQYATQFLRQKKTCCRSGPPRPSCDQPSDVDSVLMHYGMYAAPPFRRPVGLQTLYRELERDRPVVALLQYATSAHAVVITAVNMTSRFLRYADPRRPPAERMSHIDSFKQGYEGVRWFYTILTRPASVPRSKVSLLRDRMREPDEDLVQVRRPLGDTLEIDLYELDPYRLADGTGLQTPEFNQRVSFRFDGPRYDGWGGFQDELVPLRDEIEARIARGFEVRIVRCHAYKLEALWFTDPTDPSHRADHYLLFGSLYDLEDKEYSPAELRDAMIKIAPIGLAAVEHSRKWIERLDRETAYQNDDGGDS